MTKSDFFGGLFLCYTPFMMYISSNKLHQLSYGVSMSAGLHICSGALRTVWVYEIHLNAVFLSLYL